MTTPTIPSWEWQDLQDLSQQGDLSGINPIVIGSIDQAESSGNGGGINPEGYGGFFGLSESGTYPGGQVTPQLLQGTDADSFEQQAEIAASAYASYLNQAGGNPIAAQEIYQTGAADGPTEGSNILATNLGTASPSGGATASTTSATTTSLNANPFDLFGIPSTAAGSVETWATEALLVAAGLGIIVLGVYKLASPALGQAKSAIKPPLEAAAA